MLIHEREAALLVYPNAADRCGVGVPHFSTGESPSTMQTFKHQRFIGMKRNAA